MDERFAQSEGRAVLTGNELIVKGGLEGRMALLTGYPGSPVAQVFSAAQACRPLLLRHGILAQIANNEALAGSRLHGARMANVRAMAVFKSVGMHVAADGLALGNLSEPGNTEGGAIVVVGDDPWMESTQNNNDSRYLSQHLHIPVLEPSTFQELKDWVDAAFDLSGKSSLYVTYLVSTNHADGGGTVQVRPNQYPQISTNSKISLTFEDFDYDRMAILPPRTWDREASLAARFKRLWGLARAFRLNRIFHAESAGSDSEPAPIGFITSGLSYAYLEQGLGDLNLTGRFPILKLGITYPIDPDVIKEFLGFARTIVVVEEKRSFMESQIVGICRDLFQSGEIAAMPSVWGKKFPFNLPGIPEEKGLNPSLIVETLIPLLKNHAQAMKTDLKHIEALEARYRQITQIPLPPTIARTPTFCPGCPHRDSSSVFLTMLKDFKDPNYMWKRHRRGPAQLVFHGDTGCYSMLVYTPNKFLMNNYAGMGLGGGTGAGIDPFITNKQVIFLGDGTFFHSGMLAVSDSIKNKQDITYIILDNKTTAMTGHQPHAGTETDIMGRHTFSQNIEHILLAMSDANIPITRVDPADRDRYRALVEETILKDGVKIIIADKECGITFQRKVKILKKQALKEAGYLPVEKRINITADVCEYCLECTNTTGCPGLNVVETDFGPKISTDLSVCVSDGACAKGKVCPSFEEVVIYRRQAPGDPMGTLNLDTLPAPRPPDFDKAWNAYIGGIGGQGAGVASAILTHAGAAAGYHVVFNDKKGLAIRNGGVYSHISFSREDAVRSPIISYADCDLILGMDILEAFRACDPRYPFKLAHPDKTYAVVNNTKNPTITTLTGEEDFSPAAIEPAFRNFTKDFFSAPLGDLCEKYLGGKTCMNVALLGAAYQLGRLPLSWENLKAGLSRTVRPADMRINLQAFLLGRKIAAAPAAFMPKSARKPYRALLSEKAALLERRREGLGRRYQEILSKAADELHLEDSWKSQFALRVYDLILYENENYAQIYADFVRRAFIKDSAAYGHHLTRAVLWNLHKVMAIKDEIFVAELLTREEKLEEDKQRYNIDESRGDRIDYVHLNRPQFNVLGWDIQWDMRTKNWMLHLMKQMKFLRWLLPQWHSKEKAFRDWYAGHLERMLNEPALDEKSRYDIWVKVLRLPEKVTGYRQIRHPKMEKARAEAGELLASRPRRTPALVP